MKLYFVNEDDKKIFKADVETREQAFKKINEILDERGFEHYYTRCWNSEDGDGIWVDYGSHTSFFFIEGAEVGMVE